MAIWRWRTCESYELTRGEGVKHTLIAPYHPPLKGKVERLFQLLSNLKWRGATQLSKLYLDFCSVIEQNQIAQRAKRQLSYF